MNAQDLSNALLLRETGELPPAQVAELEAYLLEHPEAARQAGELQTLQEAGRFASQLTVPALSPLDLERIRVAGTKHPARWAPQLLAAAAAVAIVLFGLPFLTSPAPQMVEEQFVEVGTPRIDLPFEPVSEDLPESDDLWQEVADLEAELDAWNSLSLKDPWLVEDEASWAAELLAPGDSI